MTMKYVSSRLPMSKTGTMFAWFEPGREPRLVQEHRDEALVLREVRQHALDRDVLLEALHADGFAAEDLGHAAGFEPLDDAILLLFGGGHREHDSAAAKRRRGATIKARPCVVGTLQMREHYDCGLGLARASSCAHASEPHSNSAALARRHWVRCRARISASGGFAGRHAKR